jgi:hypothetical protein
MCEEAARVPHGRDIQCCGSLQYAFKGMKNVETISLWGNAIKDLHEDTFKDTKKLKYEHNLMSRPACPPP